ncbi:MAG: multidrug resistance efflux pump [Pirellulaceae bacterium]|jgi:multidrug resistance efflux pump
MSRKQHKLAVNVRSRFFAMKMTKRQKVTVWLTSLLLVVLIAGCNSASDEPVTTTALPVATLRLQQSQQFEAERTYSGVVRAARTSELGFERTGQLVEVSVDEGDGVYAGQSLAKLDTRNLESRLKQLQAEQQSAEALLQELEAGPRAETIAAQRAQVEELSASYELQKLNLNRRSELRQTNTISAEELDQFQFEAKASAARLNAAEQRLLELENGTRKEKIAAQRAAVARLVASIDDVNVDLQESELRAPFSGTISQRFHDEGTILPPASKLLRLVETDQLEVWIGMPVRTAANLKLGMTFGIQVDSRTIKASVAERLPELDPATRTQTVVFVVDNSEPVDIIPGQLARVTIDERHVSTGFWVPTAALVRSARGLWSVYALDDKGPESAANGAESEASGQESEASGQERVVQRRDVEVVYTRGDRSYIRGTVVAGDEVVTVVAGDEVVTVVAGDEVVATGTHRIVPGQRVRGVTNFIAAEAKQVADTQGGLER